MKVCYLLLWATVAALWIALGIAVNKQLNPEPTKIINMNIDDRAMQIIEDKDR